MQLITMLVMQLRLQVLAQFRAAKVSSLDSRSICPFIPPFHKLNLPLAEAGLSCQQVVWP